MYFNNLQKFEKEHAEAFLYGSCIWKALKDLKIIKVSPLKLIIEKFHHLAKEKEIFKE